MIDGVLNVYKEKGYTSHDVVAKLRKITGQRKVGHTGTLDPDAEGVLPVCFGKATKLCGMLTDKDKCYETVMLLGVETDTQDISGKTVCKKTVTGIDEAEVEQAAKSFMGIYEQLPPMYSAVKVNGKKLYELARAGKTAERQTRPVEIYDIQILAAELPRVHMRVHCSKGTYIRTLCHDIGRKLGCGACMEELARTRTGMFLARDSLTLEQIESRNADGTLLSAVVPIDQMFPGCSKIIVGKGLETCAYNGGLLPKGGVVLESEPKDQERVRVYDGNGAFVGIYRYEEESGKFKAVKMFYHERQ